jgi:23S rRNA (adenine2503-C2)-methyltransferase
LQGLTPSALADVLGSSLPEARKVVSAVHASGTRRAGGVWTAGERPALQGVRRVVVEAARRLPLPTLEVRARVQSLLDPFVKLSLAAPDGAVFETVRIPLERAGRFSVCVSSQAGCALACAFCATGRIGLSRNLETWEIVEQVRVARGTLDAGQRVHGVVFQGMGEPLANLDRVVDAIAVMCEPSALAIDARNITVCTSGSPGGIRRLARELPKVRLGISIASARPSVRRALMPIDAAHPLDEVLEAAAEHGRTTGLAPMWAVTPLAGVNDTEEDAAALAALSRGFEAKAGVRPRLSVVPYNPIASDGSDPFARGNVETFLGHLVASGLRPHLRYSGGSDVAAACGQLAAGAAAKRGSQEDRKIGRWRV